MDDRFVRRPIPAEGDPPVGSYLIDDPAGIVHPRFIGSLVCADDDEVPVVTRGVVFVQAPAGNIMGRHAYARRDGKVYAEPGDDWNRLVGRWASDRDEYGLAVLDLGDAE